MHKELNLEIAILALCNKGSIFNLISCVLFMFELGIKEFVSVYGASCGGLGISDNYS